jgi:hypothetical protein
VQKGFRYEYSGRVLRADGTTPVKGVSVWMARGEAPELRGKKGISVAEAAASTQPVEPLDKATKGRTRPDGRYVGVLETAKGWEYSEGFGLHGGPTRPPDPPVLDEVIVYVQEKGRGTMGYRLRVPAEAQAEAISGLRKVHVPDLLIPEVPTTRGTTRPTTAP